MRISFRMVLFCVFGIALALPFTASAGSAPDGAPIRVSQFTFPQAAYTGAEEEAGQLSAAFRNQLVSALQQAGLTVVVPSKEKDAQEDAGPVSEEPAKTPLAKGGKKAHSVEGKTAADEGEGAVDDGTGEKDALMAAVEEAEKGEKAQQENEKEAAGKAESRSSIQSKAYVITGTVTQYEEHVGAPVSTGKTKRSRAEVTFHCTYKVKNPAGKVIISEETSASSARVVVETMDIHAALQNLRKKVFFEASHNIAERVSGKTRVKSRDDADPGSEDDEYADSPGKRLNSKSGRTKIII